ncbi:hypothetical protein CRM22_008500 [Opisthorchis felineus]|uniref:Uncharacterized protein n=1 Tax=Opisthorchis felineus TaxID=147828 RepID=A0A4S2LBI3_OPIFE|nr:hypothetical protein CRM22_008500 [Opisthorchis felineus]
MLNTDFVLSVTKKRAMMMMMTMIMVNLLVLVMFLLEVYNSDKSEAHLDLTDQPHFLFSLVVPVILTKLALTANYFYLPYLSQIPSPLLQATMIQPRVCNLDGKSVAVTRLFGCGASATFIT